MRQFGRRFGAQTPEGTAGRCQNGATSVERGVTGAAAAYQNGQELDRCQSFGTELEKPLARPVTLGYQSNS